MSDLLWILLFAAFSAVWLIASGFLAYAWSDGNERTQGRFYALFLALYSVLVYVLFMD